MQRKYVFKKKYIMNIQDVRDSIAELKGILLALDSKEQSELLSDEFVDKAEEYNPGFKSRLLSGKSNSGGRLETAIKEMDEIMEQFKKKK